MYRIYISAPVSGYNIRERRMFFHEVSESLRDKGFETCNPLEYASDNDDYEACMKRDIRMLLDCDAIVMCDGWMESRGCKAEYYIARLCGLEVYNLEAQFRMAPAGKYEIKTAADWRVALFVDEDIRASKE